MSRKTQRKVPVRAASKPALALGALKEIALARGKQARKAVIAGAAVARVRTSDAVSRLERVFERRVTGVISRLGVPSARDVRALSRQVAHLQQSVDQLKRVRAR